MAINFQDYLKDKTLDLTTLQETITSNDLDDLFLFLGKNRHIEQLNIGKIEDASLYHSRLLVHLRLNKMPELDVSSCDNMPEEAAVELASLTTNLSRKLVLPTNFEYNHTIQEHQYDRRVAFLWSRGDGYEKDTQDKNKRRLGKELKKLCNALGLAKKNGEPIHTLLEVLNATHDFLDGKMNASQYDAKRQSLLQAKPSRWLTKIGVLMVVIGVLAVIAGIAVAASGVGTLPGVLMAAAGVASYIKGQRLFNKISTSKTALVNQLEKVAATKGKTDLDESELDESRYVDRFTIRPNRAD